MSIANFIPAVWAGKVLENLQKEFVYVSTCNRDYEGEITAYGDSVKINSIGAVTIKSFTKNTNIDAPEELTSAQTTLLINQGNYFNFQVDSVDDAQTKPKVMDAGMLEAATGLAGAADVYVAGLYTNFSNDLGDLTITKVAEAYDILVDMSVALDNAKVPKAGRSAVITPEFHALLRKDPRFTDKSASGLNVLENGEIGMVAGMTIKVSLNVPVAATYAYITATYTGTISYADQILEMRAYQPEARFADAVKGLHVFGAKVVRPTAGVYVGTKIALA